MSLRRTGLRALPVLAALLVLVYGADWAWLRARVPRGTAFGVVQVHQMLATPLKGNKEEYDFVGDTPVARSRSLFPQAGNQPCWWLARHTTQWQ